MPLQMRKMVKTVTLMSIGICLGMPAVPVRAGDDPVRPTVKLLLDFEEDDALAVWGGSKPGAKWAGNNELRGEISDEWASSGKWSLKVTFDKYEKGEQEWRVALLNLAKLGLGDFRGWDTVELDGYVVTPDAGVKVRLMGDKQVLSGTKLPTGHWRLAFQLDRPDADLTNIDLSKMKGIQLSSRQPPKRMVGYLDRIRLVDYKAARLAAMSRQVTAAIISTERLTDGAARERILSELQPLKVEINTTSERLKRAKTGTERDTIRAEVVRLEMATAARIRDVAGRLAGPMAEMLAALEPGQLFDMPKRSRTGKAPLPSAKGLDPEHLEAAARRLLAYARRERGIHQHYGDAPFAVGIPPWPRSMPDRPQSYDGPIAKTVHISAARHEYEPFQLVLLPKGNNLKNVRLKPSALVTSDGNSTIGPENIEIAPMGWRQRVEDGQFWAEMLRSDVRRFDVAADAQQPVWVNVYVPPGTPSGDYTGTITIHADDVTAVIIALELTVWPLTLPTHGTMLTAADGWGDSEQDPEKLDENARRMIAHRFNPNAIYSWYPRQFPGAKTWQRWHEWGGGLFNVLRINRLAMDFYRDKEGRMHVKKKVMEMFFKKLDKRIPSIREAGLLDQCMLFGFDELPTGMVPAADEMFGVLKERYGPIKTMIAANLPIWEQYPKLENIDIIAFTPMLLTGEVMELYRRQGIKLLWYNLYHNQQDEVRNRVQFWATLKDGLDGVLHYGLVAGKGAPYGSELYPPADRKPGFGGILRLGPQRRVISTLAFEYFREGLEDCEYLHMLKAARDRLANQPADIVSKHRDLLRKADFLIRVPDYVTTGIIGDKTKSANEIAVGLEGNTDDMNVILTTRRQIARLIVSIREVLGARDGKPPAP